MERIPGVHYGGGREKQGKYPASVTLCPWKTTSPGSRATAFWSLSLLFVSKVPTRRAHHIINHRKRGVCLSLCAASVQQKAVGPTRSVN